MFFKIMPNDFLFELLFHLLKQELYTYMIWTLLWSLMKIFVLILPVLYLWICDYRMLYDCTRKRKKTITVAKPDWTKCVSKVWPLSFILLFVALQKKQLLCPAAEFVLGDYTVCLSGTWQGFVVSHTFLDNMADLLIWHGVHPCHLITGRILILKSQDPNVRETDGERKRNNTYEERGGKMKWIPQPDGACMIDEQWKAINLSLGAGSDRLKLIALKW